MKSCHFKTGSKRNSSKGNWTQGVLQQSEGRTTASRDCKMCKSNFAGDWVFSICRERQPKYIWHNIMRRWAKNLFRNMFRLVQKGNPLFLVPKSGLIWIIHHFWHDLRIRSEVRMSQNFWRWSVMASRVFFYNDKLSIWFVWIGWT